MILKIKILTRKLKKLGIPECRCYCIIGMMGADPCQAIHQDLAYAMTLEASRNQPRCFFGVQILFFDKKSREAAN
jgi:hypothetical protein